MLLLFRLIASHYTARVDYRNEDSEITAACCREPKAMRQNDEIDQCRHSDYAARRRTFLLQLKVLSSRRRSADDYKDVDLSKVVSIFSFPYFLFWQQTIE